MYILLFLIGVVNEVHYTERSVNSTSPNATRNLRESSTLKAVFFALFGILFEES